MRTIILGTTPLAFELINIISMRASGHSKLVGVVSESIIDSQAYLTQGSSLPVLGTLMDLQKIVDEVKPDNIIVAVRERRRSLPMHILIKTRVFDGVVVESGDEVYERVTGKLAIDSLTPSCVAFSRNFQPPGITQDLARGIGMLVSALVLIVLSPLLLTIALVIKCDSPGPVLFRQDRAGIRGKSFKIWKFRSMHSVDDRQSEWVRDNGHRITRVGKWLRKFKLDELPQFFNVLCGDMSLVGPRPHPVSNFGLFTLVSRNIPEIGGPIPYYALRSMVRPGITGWAQTRYQYANDLDEEMEKLRYDLYYIKHHSVWLDLIIVLETFKVVLIGSARVQGGEEINQEASVHMTSNFSRYTSTANAEKTESHDGVNPLASSEHGESFKIPANRAAQHE